MSLLFTSMPPAHHRAQGSSIRHCLSQHLNHVVFPLHHLVKTHHITIKVNENVHLHYTTKEVWHINIVVVHSFTFAVAMC